VVAKPPLPDDYELPESLCWISTRVFSTDPISKPTVQTRFWDVARLHLRSRTCEKREAQPLENGLGHTPSCGVTA